MRKIVRATTSQELLDQLIEIFPEFRTHWEDEDNPWRESFTFHGVMLDFNDFIGGLKAQVNEKQWRSLGTLFNAAVTEDDELENAVSTCFLEHLHQSGLRKSLWPYLDSNAKRKSRA